MPSPGAVNARVMPFASPVVVSTWYIIVTSILSLGQYYLEGPGAYVRTFALYWLSVSLDLVLWAAVWRALAEGVALVLALVAPSRAASVRRAIEIACRLLYYAGAPALVAARFLA